MFWKSHLKAIIIVKLSFSPGLLFEPGHGKVACYMCAQKNPNEACAFRQFDQWLRGRDTLSKAEDPKSLHVDSENSDQTAQILRLI